MFYSFLQSAIFIFVLFLCSAVVKTKIQKLFLTNF